MKEIWKDINGYEGLYQASNSGQIKSLKHTIIRSNGWKQSFEERILKSGLCKNGYRYVVLSTKNKGQQSYPVYSLIIKTFIENTDNKKDINHIDSNKQNNKLINLEYATRSENMKHAYFTGNCSPKNKGKHRIYCEQKWKY